MASHLDRHGQSQDFPGNLISLADWFRVRPERSSSDRPLHRVAETTTGQLLQNPERPLMRLRRECQRSHQQANPDKKSFETVVRAINFSFLFPNELNFAVSEM